MSGKLIVITGAGGGLGRALARRLAGDGDRVVLLGRTMAKLEDVASSIGERATAIQCDITAPVSVRVAFDRIAELHGTIDVLINNAGVFEFSAFPEASDQLIVEAVLANLAGPALCTRAAIPLMQRGSRIINVTSEAVVLDLPYLVMYQSAKAGLERFSSALNRELEGDGIRVTVVRAGTMMGEGMSAQMDPAVMMRVFETAKQRGFDMMARGASSYSSTLDVFRMVIDAPADLYLSIVGFHGQPVA